MRKLLGNRRRRKTCYRPTQCTSPFVSFPLLQQMALPVYSGSNCFDLQAVFSPIVMSPVHRGTPIHHACLHFGAFSRFFLLVRLFSVQVHNLHFFDHEKIETKSGKRRNDAGCCGCTFLCVLAWFFFGTRKHQRRWLT